MHTKLLYSKVSTAPCSYRVGISTASPQQRYPEVDRPLHVVGGLWMCQILDKKTLRQVCSSCNKSSPSTWKGLLTNGMQMTWARMTEAMRRTKEFIPAVADDQGEPPEWEKPKEIKCNNSRIMIQTNPTVFPKKTFKNIPFCNNSKFKQCFSNFDAWEISVKCSNQF